MYIAEQPVGARASGSEHLTRDGRQSGTIGSTASLVGSGSPRMLTPMQSSGMLVIIVVGQSDDPNQVKLVDALTQATKEKGRYINSIPLLLLLLFGLTATCDQKR